jgi:hypothetical protein
MLLIFLTIYNIVHPKANNNAIWLESTLYNQTAPAPSSPNFQIASKVAVIVETRPLSNLIPLILHFSNVLGPDWPIVLYSPLSQEIFLSSPIFERRVQSGKIQVRQLPKGVKLGTYTARSEFWMRSWIWEDLAPAEHVFMFDAESIICEKSEKKADDFLEWDFIGAPMKKGWGQGFNGALSIRRREVMLDFVGNIKGADSSAGSKSSRSQIPTPEGEAVGVSGIIRDNSSSDEYLPKLEDEITTPSSDPEDTLLYKTLVELPPKNDRTSGANLPDQESASQFAVETVYFETPFGYHRPGSVFDGEGDLRRMKEWCPEWILASSAYLPES